MNAIEGVEFVLSWWRAVIAAGDDAHPTGRASGPTAAHREMRNTVAPTCLEYGPATRHLHDVSGVGDRDQRPPKTFDSAATHSRDKHGADQCEVQNKHAVACPRQLLCLHC